MEGLHRINLPIAEFRHMSLEMVLPYDCNQTKGWRRILLLLFPRITVALDVP